MAHYRSKRRYESHSDEQPYIAQNARPSCYAISPAWWSVVRFRPEPGLTGGPGAGERLRGSFTDLSRETTPPPSTPGSTATMLSCALLAPRSRGLPKGSGL